MPRPRSQMHIYIDSELVNQWILKRNINNISESIKNFIIADLGNEHIKNKEEELLKEIKREEEEIKKHNNIIIVYKSQIKEIEDKRKRWEEKERIAKHKLFKEGVARGWN